VHVLKMAVLEWFGWKHSQKPVRLKHSTMKINHFKSQPKDKNHRGLSELQLTKQNFANDTLHMEFIS